MAKMEPLKEISGDFCLESWTALTTVTAGSLMQMQGTRHALESTYLTDARSRVLHIREIHLFNAGCPKINISGGYFINAWHWLASQSRALIQSKLAMAERENLNINSITCYDTLKLRECACKKTSLYIYILFLLNNCSNIYFSSR